MISLGHKRGEAGKGVRGNIFGALYPGLLEVTFIMQNGLGTTKQSDSDIITRKLLAYA